MGMMDENLERNGYDEFGGCESGEMRVAMCMGIGEGWVQ